MRSFFEHRTEKLSTQFSQLASTLDTSSAIFSGVTVFVTGRTNPSAYQIRDIMAANGGDFDIYFSSYVTHIIAESIPESKRKYFGRTPIVKPKWITDSLELKIRQPIDSYVVVSTASDSTLLNEQEHDIITNRSSRMIKEKGLPDTMDPEFIANYFGSSRLHHLSYWRCELKNQITDQLKSSSSFVPPTVLPCWRMDEEWNSVNKVFLHCDLDCFFVAVAVKLDPSLAGKPVAISHSPAGSGEIAACSYQAREFGIHASMWTSTAKKLCPDLVVIKYADFKVYAELSSLMYSVFAQNVPHSQFIFPVSIDEAVLDVSFCLLPPEELCAKIRSEIKLATGLDSTCGVAVGPQLARVATAIAKPNGHVVLYPSTSQQVISPLNITKLPGVGASFEAKLNRLGIYTVGDLVSSDMSNLMELLGPHRAQHLALLARGKDDSKVDDEVGSRQSRGIISTNINWGVRLDNSDDALEFVTRLVKENIKRLHQEKLCTARMILKLLIRAPGEPFLPAKWGGCGHCVDYSHSVLLTSDSDSILISTAQSSFKRLSAQHQFDPRDIRGVSVQFLKLTPRKTHKPTSLEVFLQRNLPQHAEEDEEITISDDDTTITLEQHAHNFMTTITAPKTLFINDDSLDVANTISLLVSDSPTLARSSAFLCFIKHCILCRSVDLLVLIFRRISNVSVHPDWIDVIRIARVLAESTLLIKFDLSL
ncbi:hypothetical protein RCL1_005969 [Eukaryota sp. TZLM3-RCL]